MNGGCCCFECIHEMDAGVIEYCGIIINFLMPWIRVQSHGYTPVDKDIFDLIHLGKYNRVVPAGCFCLWFPCESIAARVYIYSYGLVFNILTEI